MNAFAQFFKQHGKTLLFVVLGLFAVIWLYKFFFSRSASKQAITQLDVDIAQKSTDYMDNGVSFGEFAMQLYDMMYSDWNIFPWLKNTNEQVLGNLMLTVLPKEFSRLASVYNMVAKERRRWWQVTSGGTLAEDLLGTIQSSSNRKQYLSHLGIV